MAHNRMQKNAFIRSVISKVTFQPKLHQLCTCTQKVNNTVQYSNHEDKYDLKGHFKDRC